MESKAIASALYKDSKITMRRKTIPGINFPQNKNNDLKSIAWEMVSAKITAA